ncbi:hypothetical protein [Halomarina oriensis]|uniref:Lipoprotein n=1 Tax=Halomarina oriensis TaxID=671145 RepID=A0A6B0GQ48_9EURY|nr:hypothetical protein [Halomarina oriensis]MWG33778.1 hypothetical protein [Halomarina oriensis]
MPSRRTLLGSVVGALTGLSGCSALTNHDREPTPTTPIGTPTGEQPDLSFDLDKVDFEQFRLEYTGSDPFYSDELHLRYHTSMKKLATHSWQTPRTVVGPQDSAGRILNAYPGTKVRATWTGGEEPVSAEVTAPNRSPPWVDDPPTVRFSFRRMSAGTVQVGYDGGDEVKDHRLRVKYSDRDARGHTERWAGSGKPLREGMATRTREPVREGTTVSVWWKSKHGAWEIGKHRVPETTTTPN